MVVAWTPPGKVDPEVIGGPFLSVTADGKSPGVERRVWSDVAKLADLKKRPDFPAGRMRMAGGVLELDGASGVERPGDPVQMRELTIRARVFWTGRKGEVLLECPGEEGARMVFFPDAKGKARFRIQADGRSCEVAAEPLPRDVWIDVEITIRAGECVLTIGGRAPVSRPCSISPLDVDAGSIMLGRGLAGEGFRGRIESFRISHPR